MSRGETSMQWVDSYVEAGLSPKEIDADMIATTGNPLEDISVLKHVSFVMKNGRVIKP